MQVAVPDKMPEYVKLNLYRSMQLQKGLSNGAELAISTFRRVEVTCGCTASNNITVTVNVSKFCDG
jgi:hypothetical protein